MPSRQGTLLEKNVKRIFDLADFETKSNINLAGYEVDVYAKHNGIDIIIECKQYERSYANLPNLIYQWSGKNKKINASKVLLVIYGCNVSFEHKSLAEKENVAIWTENEVEKFLDLAIEKREEAKAEIFNNLSIKTEEVEKLRKERGELEKKLAIERYDSWEPTLDTLLKYILNLEDTEYYDIYRNGFPEYFDDEEIEEYTDWPYCFEEFEEGFGEILRFDPLGRSVILSDPGWRACKTLEELEERINSEKFSIVCLVIKENLSMGILKIAEKYGIKCIVCNSPERDIDGTKTNVKIITSKELKDEYIRKVEKWKEKRVRERSKGTPLFNESAKSKKSTKSGCFIATAAYGTPFAEEIDILRYWRDNSLNNSLLGRLFIKLYYALSPPVATFISDKNFLRALIRICLNPFVGFLRKNTTHLKKDES